MHQHAGLAVADAGGHAVVAQGRRQGHVAAGERLAQAENVRADIGVVHGEQFAGAAEAGGDFVENQQYAVLVAKTACAAQVLRVVKAHAAGALHDRFQNHCRHFVAVLFQQAAQGIQIPLVPVVVVAHRRRVREQVLGQHLAEQMVHAVDRVAGGHGPEGVTVVAVAQRDQTVLLGLPLAEPVLQRHLDRHLHGHRATVGQEHLVERFRRHPHQALAQLHRRLVGDATEHHVGHFVDLVLGRLVQTRVVVAVDRRPPGRHAVDQRAAVFQLQADSVGARHRVGGQRLGGGGIGVPEVVTVEIEINGHRVLGAG